MTPTHTRIFDEAGRRVVRRLWRVRWLTAVERSAVPLCFIFCAVTALATWRSGSLPTVYMVVAVGIVWPALAALWSWHRRPRADAALALWDEVTTRGEMYVTAWWLERIPTPTPFESCHLRLATSRIDDALTALPLDFPLPQLRRAVLRRLVACILLTALHWRMAPAQEEMLTEDARRSAAEVAAQLANRPKLPDNLDRALDEEQRDRWNQLQKDLDETTERLRSLKDEPPRDVLDELERRAFDADHLAEELGGDPEEMPSSAMLAELERHADTSELASRLRDSDLERAADEAKKLADRLEREDLTLEERRRIEQALSMSIKAGDQRDGRSMIGKVLVATEQELKKQKTGLASKKMRELAENLQKKGLRKKAQKQLQQLARQLRESGSRILDRRSPGLQALTRENSDLRSLSGDMQRASDESLQDEVSQATIMERLLMQGDRESNAGDEGAKSRGGPKPARLIIPGEKKKGGKADGARTAVRIPVPGTSSIGASSEGSGLPLPGGMPGDSGSLSAGGSGNIPIPGTFGGDGAGAGMDGGAIAGAQAGVGGHEAGRGAAPYSPTDGKVRQTTQTGAVSGRPTGDGPSQFRSTDVDERPENIAQAARDLAIEFLHVEEASLDEETLPLARREQVLRYFTAIRRRLAEPQTDARPH